MSVVSASPTSNILTESQNKRRRTTGDNTKRQKSSSSSTVVSSRKHDDRVSKLLKDAENSRVELSNLASKGAEKKLREHCTKLRKKVEASCEAAVQNIRKSTAAMIAKINNYERECLSRSAERTKIRDDIADQLRQSARLLSELKQQIDSLASSENSENQNTDFDDELIMTKLKKLKTELDAWKTHLLDCEFNNTNLSFAPNRELVRESATLGDIVSRAATAPFPLEVDKLREINVPKTRKKSTFQYAFAMCNGRQIVAFYHVFDERWQDEWEATLVCHLDVKNRRVTVKRNEWYLRLEKICHVSDERTDVLVWSRWSSHLGVFNHKLEPLREDLVKGGHITSLSANSSFIFLAQWNDGKHELSIRRLDTLALVAKIEPCPVQGIRRLVANNDYLFVLTNKETVVVIELAELAQGKVEDINWVMRTYETPEFDNSERIFLSGYSLVYYDGESKHFSLDGRDGKRRERTDEDGPRIRIVTQSGESVLFHDCSECDEDRYQPTIYIRQ